MNLSIARNALEVITYSCVAMTLASTIFRYLSVGGLGSRDAIVAAGVIFMVIFIKNEAKKELISREDVSAAYWTSLLAISALLAVYALGFGCRAFVWEWCSR